MSKIKTRYQYRPPKNLALKVRAKTMLRDRLGHQKPYRAKTATKKLLGQ